MKKKIFFPFFSGGLGLDFKESKTAKRETIIAQNQQIEIQMTSDSSDVQDPFSATSDQKSQKSKTKGSTSKFVSKLSPKTDRKKVESKTALLKVCFRLGGGEFVFC